MATNFHRKAKRYARALFELCSSGELENIENQLKLLVLLVDNNPVLLDVAQNPGYSLNERNSALASICSKAEVTDSRVINLMMVLVQNRGLSYMTLVQKEFSSLVLAFKSTVAVEISSAFPIPEAEIEEVKKKIQSQFGKVVDVVATTDAELIGGVVLKVGDRVLDRSLQGAIRAAALELTQ